MEGECDTERDNASPRLEPTRGLPGAESSSPRGGGAGEAGPLGVRAPIGGGMLSGEGRGAWSYLLDTGDAGTSVFGGGTGGSWDDCGTMRDPVGLLSSSRLAVSHSLPLSRGTGPPAMTMAMFLSIFL